MKLVSKIALIGISVGVLFTSCKKELCKDAIPEMTYSDFYQLESDTNEFKLIFKFTDCDGDIGMETDGSIIDENGETQTTNFKIDLYFFENDDWNLYEFASEDGLNSKIPDLSNSTANPILDGEIEKSLNRFTSLAGYDSIMFKSRILDNAGHYSNEVETPGFNLSK